MKPISVRSLALWGAVASFVLAGAGGVAAVWDGFFRIGFETQTVQAPGFHVLDLERPGLYAGVYQHRGSGPMPIQALSRMDVRVVSKETYRNVPVMMNNAGRTFSRFGLRGMVVFNFFIDEPGFYTLSALYTGETTGPTVSLLLIPQAAETVRTTLVAGVFFILIFTTLGIYLLRLSLRFSKNARRS